jgi:hypothetical protein
MPSKDEALREHLTRMGQNLDSWLGNAVMLKQVTELIWPTPDWARVESAEASLQHMDYVADTDMWPVGLMIAGYALESLAKGLRVANNKKPVKDGKLADDLGTHGLEKHLTKAGILLETEEQELIQRLDMFILWAGRYPIPKKLEQYAPQGRPPMMSTGDPRIFRHLFARLRQQLEAMRPTPQPAPTD